MKKTEQQVLLRALDKESGELRKKIINLEDNMHIKNYSDQMKEVTNKSLHESRMELNACNDLVAVYKETEIDE